MAEDKIVVRYAGFWTRLLAYLLDAAIIMIGVIVILLCSAMLNGLVQFSAVFGVISLLLSLLIILWIVIYFPFFTATRGATPGKTMLGIIVVDAGNRFPVGWPKALMRELLGRLIIDKLILSLGDLLIIFDSRKQALHDKIGGTYVVYKDSIVSPKEVGKITIPAKSGVPNLQVTPASSEPKDAKKI